MCYHIKLKWSYFTVTLLCVVVVVNSVSFVDEPVRVIGLTVPTKQQSQSVGLAFIVIVPVREVQAENVQYIFVTLLGIVGDVMSEAQPVNVLPISVTPSGIAEAVVRD